MLTDCPSRAGLVPPFKLVGGGCLGQRYGAVLGRIVLAAVVVALVVPFTASISQAQDAFVGAPAQRVGPGPAVSSLVKRHNIDREDVRIWQRLRHDVQIPGGVRGKRLGAIAQGEGLKGRLQRRPLHAISRGLAIAAILVALAALCIGGGQALHSRSRPAIRVAHRSS